MRAFEEYVSMPSEFWALIKFVSETLGYTKRSEVSTYSTAQLENLFAHYNIPVNYRVIADVKNYCERRAELLNDFVRLSLMDGKTARQYFEELYEEYSYESFKCKIPMNKQSGDMKKVNYFTAIINILTEMTIKQLSNNRRELGFDDDPRGLAYVFDDKNNVIGASSRRFDGAYPGIINPQIVWEIKEYYYTTTFGSRIADGVYETQLDGHEFLEIADRTGYKIAHVFFIDGYGTWWMQGKSYLCRIIDMLNSGLVDEVIFGKEVFERWPQLLAEFIN